MQSGVMRDEVVEALRAAFPDPGDMARVVGLADIGISFDDYRTAVGTTYRQALNALISNHADPQDQLLTLLRAARQKNPINEKLRTVMSRLADLEGRFAALGPNKTLGEVERIVLKGVTFEDVGVWIDKLKMKRRAICRVEPQPQAETIAGFGSAFLVAPDVVITNFHVARSFWDDEAKARRVVFRFGYEADSAGVKVSDGVEYKLATGWRDPATSDARQARRPWQVLSSPEDKLDYALLRLDKPAGTDRVDGTERGFLTLSSWRIGEDDPLLILQHPSAAPLKLAIGAVVRPDPPSHVYYKVNTEGGSSGSPCLNQRLETTALHHQGDTTSNRGITFKAIREDWSTRLDSLGAEGLAWLANRRACPPKRRLPQPRTNSSEPPLIESGTPSEHCAPTAFQGGQSKMVIPNSQADDVRELLRPLMADRNSRQARLARAFAKYPGLLGRINMDENTAVFLDLLIDTMHNYGEVEAGRPAICVLLESVKGEVGVKDRERIERIVRDYPR